MTHSITVARAGFDNDDGIWWAFACNPWARISSVFQGKPMPRDYDPERAIVRHFSSGIPDSHVHPQTWFLRGIKLDFLGIRERVEEDWPKLQKLIPRLRDLPHLNRAPLEHDWRQIDVRIWRWLYPLFAEDFALYEGWDRGF